MGLSDRIIRTLEDPLALGGLIINLIPIYAVVFLEWGAAPVVFLYWLENLVMGAITLARMTASCLKEHPVGLIGMLFYGPFFTVHYGMFCFVHGVLLASLAEMGTPNENADFFSPDVIVQTALDSGTHMPIFFTIIAGWQLVLYVVDFLLRGQFRNSSLQKEMTAPYGNLIVLHVALIIGGGIMLAIGEPMIGILALVLMRAAWGIFMDTRRILRATPADIKS